MNSAATASPRIPIERLTRLAAYCMTLRACCELSPDEFRTARTSFFPSIKATLNHILTVDWYYLEMLERSQMRAGEVYHDPAAPEPLDGLAVQGISRLAVAQQRADCHCKECCDEAIPAISGSPRSGDRGTSRMPGVASASGSSGSGSGRGRAYPESAKLTSRV